MLLARERGNFPEDPMKRLRASTLLVTAALCACGSDPSPQAQVPQVPQADASASLADAAGGVSDAGAGAGPESGLGAADPASVVSGSEWAAIVRLSPLGPPPADPTNRHADDARAAALGQRLFFDAS